MVSDETETRDSRPKTKDIRPKKPGIRAEDVGRNYRNIKAWKLSDELTVVIYEYGQKFPKDEIYGLTSQLRRAAMSVPAKIAEGANRQHKKKYLRFLYIAMGSLAETEYYLHLSRRLNYRNDGEYDKLDKLRVETASTVNGLIQAVKKETH